MISSTIASEQEALTVRLGTGFVCHLSQSVGEEQLAILSVTGSAEDAWLFVAGEWIDIGYQEEARSVLVDIRVVAAVIAAHPAERFAFYHTHPFHQDPRLIEPPSLQDIHSLALLKEECRGGGAELIGVIFDGRGRWTFDITGELERRILHDEHMPRGGGVGADSHAARHGYVERLDSAVLFDLQYPFSAWGGVFLDPSSGRDERIRTFITAARELGVVVGYTPVDQLAISTYEAH